MRSYAVRDLATSRTPRVDRAMKEYVVMSDNHYMSEIKCACGETFVSSWSFDKHMLEIAKAEEQRLIYGKVIDVEEK